MKWLHLVIIVLVSVGTLSATTINVPEDATTIQGGMDIAADGDTVLVSPGTYFENINFNGNSLTLKSLYGPELTTIDGQENGSVVLMISQEEQSTVLDGFTITNGTGMPTGDGVVGGGIAIREGSSPTLRNLIITGNEAFGGDDPAGAGMTIAINCHPTLENIEISHNHSVWGGGLAIVYESNPSLKNVKIHDNHAVLTGGGVYIGVGSSPYFEDVYIKNNRAEWYGGGIFLHDHVTPTFNKTTVRDNRSSLGGGGLISNDASKPRIVNSIFHGNIPDQLLFNSDEDYLADTVSIAYSNIQNGQEGISTGFGVLNWLEGNRSTAPCFVGAGDDLQAASTCIDSGTAFFEYEGETWIDMAADEYVGFAPDMGSFEFRAPMVYNVPGHFNTIQGAIDAAVDGDIIRVNIGTYVENIKFNGKNITLESIGGPELTIIDGNELSSVVLFDGQETRKAVLEGFTLTNGSGWYGPIMTEYFGGGICVRYHSSPTLRNLIITGNHTDLGIAAGPAGGGISIGQYSDPLLEDLIISNNTSQWGGGLSIAQHSNPIVRDVEIADNTAFTGGGGGGVYIGEHSDPYFESVFIHNNDAPAAAGFFIWKNSAPILNKVTVVQNTGPNGGGGMVTGDGAKPVLINSIFYGNSPDQIYLLYFDPELNNLPDTVTIAHSNVMMGESGIHLGIGHVNWGPGNIQTNPRLVGGDHLSPISPCIDAGTASYTFEGVTYIDMAADEYNGSAPDMGSWEVPTPTTLNVPLDFATIQLGIEVAVDGDTVLVADGTYYENINFLGKNIVVKSMNGESVTTIDGGDLESVVTITNQEIAATLDGFTITNGRGWENLEGYAIGGGINCRYSSSPTLRNLIIEGNSVGSETVLDSSMGGGIICSYGANAIIEDVIIQNNQANYGGGFVAYEASPSLNRVKIYANEGRVKGGGLTLWESDALVEQVAIYKNEAQYVGAGVWVHLGGNPTLDRVTIADNETRLSIAAGAMGAGIALSDGSNLTLKSTIVWFNTNQEDFSQNIALYPLEAPNSITILYSDIEGGESGIETNDNGTVSWAPNNIVGDPRFVDRSSGDYNLLTESPCIGTGMLGVDMGAGAELMALDTDEDLALIPESFQLSQNYPNPFNPSTSINYVLPGTGWVNLVVYDITGREVATLIDKQGLGGRHSMSWVATNYLGKPLPTGIYLYEMKYTDSQGQQFREVRKFTLLK